MFKLISRFRAGGSIIQVVMVSAFVMAVTAIAGASPGSMDTDRTSAGGEHVSLATSTETTPTTTPTPEPTTSPAGEPSTDSATPTPAPSDDSGSNHGTYVSKVARCVPSGPGHGEAVREMAQTHENEAAKANEICSRYASDSPAPAEEARDDEPGKGPPRDTGKPAKSGSPGNAAKKGKPGGR